MSLYKRNNIYWFSFTTPDGKRIQRSTQTTVKQEAQELYDKVKYESWRTKTLGEKPKKTWKEACVKWCSENRAKKSLVDGTHCSKFLSLRY